jgi:hypothetical protein
MVCAQALLAQHPSVPRITLSPEIFDDNVINLDFPIWQTGQRTATGDNWTNIRPLAYGGTPADANGYVQKGLNEFRLEDRIKYNGVYRTRPRKAARGSIKGFSNWILFPQTSALYFTAHIGLEPAGAPGRGANYEAGRESWNKIFDANKLYDNHTSEVRLNLFAYQGKECSIELRVDALEPGNPNACWVNPRLSCVPPQKAALVLIGPASYKDSMEAYAAYKRRDLALPGLPVRAGVSCRVLTLEEIYSSLPGADEAEKVKKAIYLAHQYGGAKYILFVGGPEDIPTRYTFVQHFVPGGAN